MPTKYVSTPQAPQPIGPYSQGVISGGFLFCSGQIALDPETGEIVEGDVAAQTERVLQNLIAVLREAKMGPENVVKTTVYLADMADFPKMNEVYGRYLGAKPPARTTIAAAGLPRAVKVEIDVDRGVLDRPGRRLVAAPGASRTAALGLQATRRRSCGWGAGLATLPDRRQRVQTRTVLCVPLPTTARTDWRLGLKRRWVTLWAWLTRFPNCGPLPQMSHR